MKHIFVIVIMLFSFCVFSQQMDSISIGNSKKLVITYAKPGFQFQTLDNSYKLHINFRVQFRGYLNFDDDPTSIEDFENYQNGFNVNRARMKVGGNVYKEWLKYYFEYDLEGSNQLDFRFYF